MTLIEAIKTGKRFRRKGSIGYYEPKLLPNTYFIVDEVLADDWEVEPTPITITREQFDAAWDEATHANPHLQYIHSALLKELGL
jgi:hypothetical protein